MGGIVRKAAGFVVGAGLVVGGVITGNLGLVAAGLSVASSSLASAPKSPENSPENLERLRANVDPRTPRKTVIGYTAMATDIRDEEFTDNQEQFHRFIVCASHKVQSVEEIWFDDELAWSTSTGIQANYLGYLGVETYPEGSAATAKNISTRMGSTRRYTGLAWVYLRYKLTGNDKKTDSPFAQSVPTRITIRGRGAMLPDPRNSAHDMADQSTWTWSESASRNPALALLFYLLGWEINGKLAVGKGIPPERIDLDSFITAANICDESVATADGGTEPRYRCDGVWSEGDSPTTIIDTLKACMNADLDDVGGKLRLNVIHNDLATPIADFGDDDIIDAFSWEPLTPLDASKNVVRGVFTDPSDTSLYQQIDYPEQRVNSPDGIERIDTFNLSMVQSAGQAQRLAQLRLQRQQYGGVFEANFQATAWKVTKNSVIRLTFGQTGFVQKFFRVAAMDIQQDGVVPLVLREEDPAIYGDPPLTDAIDPVFSTPYDPTNSPFVQAINRWRGEHSITETYVLDDLVTGPGGAAWRYINATPSSGQGLPVWPTASNTYWENHTEPVDPPDIGVAVGATKNAAPVTYVNTDTYFKDDQVLGDTGAVYQLLVSQSTGFPPPDIGRWALMSTGGSGAPGDNGLPGLTLLLSNPTDYIPTEPDGSGGDYSGAGGQFIFERNGTALAATFKVLEKNPNTNWITINSSGEYTPVDPSVTRATAILEADWAGQTYRLQYALTKGLRGAEGPNLKLTADAQAFAFEDQAAKPSSQTITLTAALTNLTGTATFTTTPSVTLGGSGNTRTLSVADFGSNRQVTVEASLGGIVERLTIVRLDKDVFAGDTNRVRFSRMEGNRGWETAGSMPLTADVRPIPSSIGGVIFIRADGLATASGQALEIFNDEENRFPVFPGERLSVSAIVSANGSSSWSYSVQFFDSAGSNTSTTTIASGATADNNNISAFIQVPSNVVEARVRLVCFSPGAGAVWGHIGSPMVATASEGQAVHPAYAPGPNAVDGAQVNPADLAELDPAQNTKLDGVEANAQVNPADLAELDPDARAELDAATGQTRQTVSFGQIITRSIPNNGTNQCTAIVSRAPGPNGTIAARIEYRLSGSATWIVLATGNSEVVAPSEPGVSAVSATFTNTTGSKQAFQFRMNEVRSPSTAGGNQIASQTYLEA